MMTNLRSRRWLIGGTALVGVLGGVPAAKAVLQVFTANGVITSITSGSELDTDFDVGDPFVVVAVYDDALLTGSPSEQISLDPDVNPGHSFDLTIGNPAVLTFDETVDELYGFGFPRIDFANGNFTNFNFGSVVFQFNGIDFDASVGSSLVIRREPQSGGGASLTGEFVSTSQEPSSPD